MMPIQIFKQQLLDVIKKKTNNGVSLTYVYNVNKEEGQIEEIFTGKELGNLIENK